MTIRFIGIISGKKIQESIDIYVKGICRMKIFEENLF